MVVVAPVAVVLAAETNRRRREAREARLRMLGKIAGVRRYRASIHTREYETAFGRMNQYRSSTDAIEHPDRLSRMTPFVRSRPRKYQQVPDLLLVIEKERARAEWSRGMAEELAKAAGRPGERMPDEPPRPDLPGASPPPRSVTAAPGRHAIPRVVKKSE